TPEGKWLWPGFGDNSRVLKWMCDRVEGKVGAKKTAIGLLPQAADLDLNGAKIPNENVTELLRVDEAAWKAEVPEIDQYFALFGTRLPPRVKQQLRGLAERLG
ncbi:MAG: phosphoenolpyruvate carboxykinase domain-containing protein, partial [Candidatus Binatia bacterium]